jgi:hypothetical protein
VWGARREAVQRPNDPLVKLAKLGVHLERVFMFVDCGIFSESD